MTSRMHAKGSSDTLLTRVEVGAQIEPAEKAIGGPLDIENPLGRDFPLLPLGDGVGSDSYAPGQFGLGHTLKQAVKGTVVHMSDYVHHRLIKVNQQLIVPSEQGVEHKRMVDTPHPRHFSSFADWLEAVMRSRDVTKADVARAGGSSPQAASKWFKGGGLDVPHLRKLADWAGADYSELRTLLDKQPLPKARGRLREIPKSGDVMRISRKLDQIAWDDDALKSVEALVDHLTSRSGSHKRKQA